MSDYPEHDKLSAISDKSQAIGEFLDWLMYGGLDESAHHPGQVRKESFGSIELAFRRHRKYHKEEERDHDLTPLNWPVKHILAAYFEIDSDKIEAEKRAMLDAISKTQGEGETES